MGITKGAVYLEARGYLVEDFLDRDIEFSDVVEYLDENDSHSSPEDVFDKVVEILQELREEVGRTN